MSLKITIMGSERITRPEGTKEFDNFDKLADAFQTVQQGEKSGAGFLRGALKKGGTRCDEDLEYSEILILDVDAGKKGRNAPKPEVVHQALTEAEINHFIYTSHSHSETQNKYRVVIESSRYERKDLVENTSAVFSLLAEHNIFIYYGKEMKAWSQHWHLPRREDVTDKLYYWAKYTDGIKWRISYVEEKQSTEKAPEAERDQEGDNETLDELHENIRTGKEFHESLRTLTYQWVRDGMSKANTKALAKTLMNGSVEAGTDRWTERYKEIDRLVDGINTSGEEIGIDDIPEVQETALDNSKPPMPHGRLGQFINETREFMLYQDDTIAFVSCMFMLSSICGRKFNVDIIDKEGRARPTALNMYFTLAAETGVGKSEIENAVENAYNQFPGATGVIRDFFFKGRVTGPKALYRTYKDQRSIGFICNEAGIEGQSSLGDSQGLHSAWLNLYGQGSWKSWTGSKELSDADGSIKSVRAVAISRVSESTPVELSKYYRQGNSVENGLIPRENIFVIKKLNETYNRNMRLEYSDEIVDKMNDLVPRCHSDVAEDTLFKKYIITVDDQALLDDMIGTMEHYRALQNRGTSIHERAMSGRMFVKMLRYCGLITAFNKDADNERSLLIDWEDWKWAKRLVEWEFARVSDVVALTSGDNTMDALVDYFIVKINAILKDTTNSNEARITPEERKVGVIPPTNLRKLVRTNPMLKEIEGDPRYSNQYKSGFDKVIDYMVKLDYIERLDKNPTKRGKALKILPALVDEWNKMVIK